MLWALRERERELACCLICPNNSVNLKSLAVDRDLGYRIIVGFSLYLEVYFVLRSIYGHSCGDILSLLYI